MAMTNQEAFEIMKKHLLCQNARSVDHNGNCKFRGSKGLKCALGALLDDDIAIAADTVGRDLGLDHLSSGMLSEMRMLHDNHFVTEWPKMLEDIAKRYGY